MPNLPSGGKISLAMRCVGSVVLPHVKDEVGPEAIAGKDKHAKLEEFLKGGRQIPDSFTEAERDLCIRAGNTVPVATIERSEFALAVDPGGRVALWNPPDSAIRDGHRAVSMGRAASKPRMVSDGSVNGGGVSDDEIDRADWFVAIADLVQWRGGSSFAVFDWKSSGWVQDPEYNWQLLLPAIWLYISADRPSDFSCELGIVYIGKPTAATGDASDAVQCFERTDPYYVNADDIERHLRTLGWLKQRIASAEKKQVTLYEGKHCNYCPARHRCPAKIGALGLAMLSLSKDPSKIPDVELVRVSMALLDSKPQIDKMARNVLRENGGEMDLGDGRVAVLTKSEKTGKEKVFTRKNKNVKTDAAGSDVAEDDSSESEDGGAEAPEGVRGSGKDPAS